MADVGKSKTGDIHLRAMAVEGYRGFARKPMSPANVSFREKLVLIDIEPKLWSPKMGKI